MMYVGCYTLTDTGTATTSSTCAAYSPGDTGNWTDIGPWFASVMFALVITPFAFLTLVTTLRKYVFRHV